MSNLTSQRAKEMLSYVPAYYETSRVYRSLLEAEGREVDALRQAIEQTLKQMYVNTATWGLERWERELGIPVSPDKPVSERRSVIKAKVRGVGTVTVQLMQNVAQAYERGEVEIINFPQEYRFTVRFVDTIGTPPNLDDLKEAIEQIKPAHLNVEYEFKYLLIEQVHQVMTLNEIESRSLTDFAPFVPVSIFEGMEE